MTLMGHDRFVNSALSELKEANYSPIYGYQHLPVLTLEEATEKLIPLVPGVVDYVSKAKENCHRSSTLLTRDESAAIYLYSMPISFFSGLNEALRAEDRHKLKPWFAFLRLFINALEKLPSIKATIWRGVSGDVGSIFADGDVHIWWCVNSCSVDISVVKGYLDECGTLFAIDASHGKDISEYSVFPAEKEIVLMPGTRLRAKCYPLTVESRFFLIHLQEENEKSELQSESRHLFEPMKQAYQQNNRIERIMNPSKSFPIEKSYINLAIVGKKEQQEKEKKLLSAKHSNEIIVTFEEIHGTKTGIEISSIFEKCNDQKKNILILGRAGIGKTTFCRYAAYQWAKGVIWQQYQLVIFIRLRNLTEIRYPSLESGIKYSLVDIIKIEYFHHGLEEKYERFLKEELNSDQVLWLLDGYDEIVQTIPAHLQYLLEQLLKTPHHILTSRPYLNTLSYNLQVEITGFTDYNIKEYVKQFFDQIKDELDNASLQAKKLLTFLKCNFRIWGTAHIPVNLELICSLWCDTDWSETTTLTVTAMYDKMTEWLCRRHLGKKNIASDQMTKEDVYTYLHKELAFLESLAFNGMESNSIILPPKLLRIASKESECSLSDQSHLLNIGILKSLDYKPIGTRIEADKNHYFLHLSFQEHFAARYLVRALNGTADQQKKMVEFIKSHKYNQRFELVLTFASGLIIDYNDGQYIKLFWETLLEEPLDLIGIRHVQIIIYCLEEVGCDIRIPQLRELIELIIKWINYLVCVERNYSTHPLSVSLRRSPSLVNQSETLGTLVKLYKDGDPSVKENASSFISDLPISNLSTDLLQLHLTALQHKNRGVRSNVYTALTKITERPAMNQVINELMILLGDTNEYVRSSTCEILQKIGETAATNEVIDRLHNALRDTNEYVRSSACSVLESMRGKAATDEVINALTNLLGDKNEYVRSSACSALGRMGEKAATDEVINALANLLGDKNEYVRSSACSALGRMGEKAATDEVIHALANALGDPNELFRRHTFNALENMGEKAATDEVIDRLCNALRDTNEYVRSGACSVLERMGGKAATDEVIHALANVLGDKNEYVRSSASSALERMGETAATDEVINALANLLGDKNEYVRSGTCEILQKIGKTAATNEVIDRLHNALRDTNEYVRSSACSVLERMGGKAATDEVINALANLLGDTNEYVRSSACSALGRMGEKAATDKVIHGLANALGDPNELVKRHAFNALENIGEKAATNEVINALTNVLGDTNEYVRCSACSALGRMGEKAATDEAIDGLANALGDPNELVRRHAFNALENMGEKAATNEVIDRLGKALGDTNDNVRRYACSILGKMGEKVATDGLIKRFLILLDDMNECVKSSACKGLGKMGKKAANTEVINSLIIALSHRNIEVQWGAYFALGKMVEMAATNEVINGLVNALENGNLHTKDSACNALLIMTSKAVTTEIISRVVCAITSCNPRVRSNVCMFLGKMGDIAATSEVFNSLVTAVLDEDDDVRSNACEALEKIGDKVATVEVINRLAMSIGNVSPEITESICNAFKNIGEKAATKEVISSLVIAIENTSHRVRYIACEAIGKFGIKVATEEVIHNLVTAITDENQEVRWSACYALREFREKAATDKVINRLIDTLDNKSFKSNPPACFLLGKLCEIVPRNEIVICLIGALGDRNYKVRHYAFEALRIDCIKIKTDEVISRLSDAIVSENYQLRSSACQLIQIFSEKIVNNEVMERLLDACVDNESEVRYAALEAVENILRSCSCISHLKATTVQKLSSCIHRFKGIISDMSFLVKCIQSFLDSEVVFWLLIIRMICIQHGHGMTVAENTIVLYVSEERVMFSISKIELGQRLREYFISRQDERFRRFGSVPEVFLENAEMKNVEKYT